MSKFSDDVIKLFEEFKRETGKYQDLDLEKVEFEEKELKDISEEVLGGFAYGNTTTSGIMHLRPNNISEDGKLVFDKVKFVPEKLRNEKEQYFLEEGDILFNTTNSIDLVGKTCYINRDLNAFFSNHMTRIRLKSNYNPLYVSLHLQSLFLQGYFKNIATKWVNQAGISLDKLKEIKIFTPKSIGNYSSYEIQKAIADFIEFVSLKSDDVINLMEEIIEKAKKGKENLIYKMFDKLPNGEITDDVVNLFNEFKEEKGYQDLNLEDLEFEEKILIDFGDGEGICKQRMGFTPKTSSDGDIYFFKVGDLSKVEGLEIIEPQTEEMIKMEYVDEVLGKKSKKRTPIQKGEILVSFKLTVGVAKIYNSDKLAYCNEAIDILTPKEGYYNKYLAMVVGEKYKEKANSETVKGKSLNENLKKLIYVPIPKPTNKYTSYQIQKIIAEFIEFVYDKFENIKENAKEEINKANKLKNLILKKVFS